MIFGVIRLLTLSTIHIPLSQRETLAEGHQQPGRTLEADAPAQQRSQQASLFRHEAQPRLAVGGHTQVGLALMTVLYLQGAVPNRDGCPFLLLAGEGEVVDGIPICCRSRFVYS
jgi:hypothetical protein